MNLLRKRSFPFSVAALGLCLLTAGSASAQFATGFEAADVDGNYAAPAPLTGQNGWYIPSVGGDDMLVDTNDGGQYGLGLPVNPNGGGQIAEGVTFGDGNLVRGQHDYAFGSSGTYTITYDVCVSGFGPHYKNNASSVSLQDSTVANYTQTLNIYLKRPGSAGRNIKWSNLFLGFDSTGSTSAFYRLFVAGAPNSAFDKLKLNNWYTMSFTVDFGTNALVAASSTDVTGGGSTITVDFTTISPTLYLAGGAGNSKGLPAPTAFRLAVLGGTGGVAGNVTGYDNVSISGGTAPQAGQTYPAVLVPVKKVSGDVD